MRDEINAIVKSLLIKVREGNQAAFEELLEIYSPLISSFVAKFRAEHEVADDVEDFKQELIMVLYNSSLAYVFEQNEVSFGLYAKICMNNAFVSQLRKLSRGDRTRALLEYDDSIEEMMDEQKSPENELIEREKLKEINKKIESVLSEFENKVWKMYVAGYSIREISSLVNKDEKSVNNAIFRIRNKLKPIFIK